MRPEQRDQIMQDNLELNRRYTRQRQLYDEAYAQYEMDLLEWEANQANQGNN
jgi:hypothetical protein